MALSIVLINFKSPQLHIDCLTEIYRDPVGFTFEVIEVDNNSGDDSRERILGAFPQVKWVQMDSNAGFARGNNAGMRVATGDTMLILNGDTLPRGKDIETCYRRLLNSDYVAAGVQLLSPDGSRQISGNYAMKGGLNYLLMMPYLGGFFKWLGYALKVKKPHVPDQQKETEVDWINGAFLMVRKEAIDKAGMMDEDFFLYAEESEWCGRLRKIGKMAIFGDLEVIHLQGVTANLAFGSDGKGYVNIYDRKGLQLLLSNFVRIRKEFGVGWYLIQLLIYILNIPIFFLGMLWAGLTGRKRYTWTKFRQYCANVGVVLRKTPAIIRNKPYFYKVI
jgi:GT2 family glycosyltransferase